MTWKRISTSPIIDPDVNKPCGICGDDLFEVGSGDEWLYGEDDREDNVQIFTYNTARWLKDSDPVTYQRLKPKITGEKALCFTCYVKNNKNMDPESAREYLLGIGDEKTIKKTERIGELPPCPSCGGEDFKLDYTTRDGDVINIGNDDNPDDNVMFETIQTACLTPLCESRYDSNLRHSLWFDSKDDTWKLFGELYKKYKDKVIKKWRALDEASE